jgi:CheY-like chemotaxis protein
LPVDGPSRPPGEAEVEQPPQEEAPEERSPEESPGPSASSLDFARDRLRTGPEADLNLVLCVDDDEGVITLFRRYLSKRGYRVVGLTDSTAVVEQARKLRPFAITLDVMMPGKDGWEVIGELKADPETRHIPVIMCTIVTDWDRGLSMGASDYLVKPILERDLLDALERLDGDEGPYRVLIIDDEPQDLELLSRILNDQGKYEVVTATGGLEAITCIQDARPDLIILDLLMPEVDGFAVLEAVKSDEATRSVPIIVVTAKDLTQEDRDRLNMRVEVLLQKGLFEQQELLEDVAAALERIGHVATEQTGGQRTTSNDEVTD